MANAIFTTQVNSPYDDLPEFRYHFPRTYLRQVEQALGDWIIYYEPRREGSSLSSSSGRQAYFAIARVEAIVPDSKKPDYYYAHLDGYLEFVKPVPFRLPNGTYPEATLRKADGSTNKGRFGRSVRAISLKEFQAICALGLADVGMRENSEVGTVEPASIVCDEPAPYGRPDRTVLTERPFREAAFAKIVRLAYNSTCAMTGLQLVNGGGRCEIEAAHIRAVEDDGPDSPRNGLALSRTIHWMFDRGIFSVGDTGEILVARRHAPDQVLRMLNPDMRIKLPANRLWTPHANFLRFHRENRFKGN